MEVPAQWVSQSKQPFVLSSKAIEQEIKIYQQY